MQEVSIVLSTTELQDLTGAKANHKIISVLDEMGISYLLRSNGSPAVDRVAYYQKMGVKMNVLKPRRKPKLNLVYS